VLFVEAPRDEAQVERIARAFDVPLLYNYASGGRSPLLPFAQLRALGYAILILPIDTLLVATRAMADFLAGLRERDDVRGLPTPSISFADFNELIGTTEQVTLAERYRSFPE
jgi:2-methylisocitrate lyase-like PEP mutase family enzyme